MSLTDIALKHRLTVFFLTVWLVVVGGLAYWTLPRESSPDVSIPLIIVTTPYPGASPEDVESQVTRPVEREVQGVKGLKRLSSVSQESVSSVTVEFVSGTDIDTALQKVRDRVSLAEVDFPQEAEDPILQEINFSDIPVLQVNLAGDVGSVALRRLAEDLQDRVEAVPGVLRANLVGGREREVLVEVDPERLRLYELSLDDVIDAVSGENVSIPGGRLDLGDRSYAVRVPGEVAEPRRIGDFVIKAPGSSPIYVRDVAAVSFGFEDRASYARIDGRESVALSVQKRVGANIIEVADEVRRIVDETREGWPESVEVTVLADQSKDIRRMVADLENNIASGLVLVVLVLMFVLGLRAAIFVGLAIPFSMLLTFAVLDITGTTLNMVVLFSLVLAVGMLVDNAVVVVENIYRHVQEGLTPLEAASHATREVSAAIAVSTFTTVGAFTPLIFWPGVVGDFMSYLPVTVIYVLLASLLVAFTINPVICSVFLRAQPEASAGGAGGRRSALGRRLQRAEAWSEERYQRFLEWALDHRALILASVVGAFLVVLVLFAGPFNTGSEFFPETEPNQILVDVEMPPGSPLDRTDDVVRQLESQLQGIPDVEVVAASSGAGSQSDDLGLSGDSRDPTRGRVTLDLLDRSERVQSSFRTLDQARRQAVGLPGATIEVDRPEEGPPVGDPLSIEIQGDDFTTLGAIAARVRQVVADIPGLVTLDDDFDLARPEVLVQVDRDQAARLGLTTEKIARTVRTAINGTKASTYRYGEDQADVTVRLDEASRRSLASLAGLAMVNDNGDQIPLSAVAELQRSSALTSIKHKERRRVVTVSGKVSSPQMAEPVRREAQNRLEAQADLLPPGYAISFAGQSEDEAEATAFLSRAFLFGVLIVLALMVGKFDSLLLPGIILTSVAMSMIGVLLGLMVTGLPFGIIMTGLGVISLAGIVVNNAIVLLDYGEQQWARGMERRALVVTTGVRRLRPVVLTAVTTILGLIPLSTGVELDFHTLAFTTGGESSQWWQGMGVAVIFGLAFATFLTLVVVPILYDLVLQLRERRNARHAAEPPPEEDREDAELPVLTAAGS